MIPELLEGVGCTQNRFHKHDVFDHTLSVVDATQGDAVVRLGALLHDVGKPRARQPREGAPGEFSFFKHEYVGAEMADAICRRLKLANADRERVVALVKNHMFFYMPDWSDGTIRRFVRRVGGQEGLADLFALREGDVKGRGFGENPDEELGELRSRIAVVADADAALKVTDLAIDGSDVMRILGHRPEPRDRRHPRAAAGAGARRSVAERAREAGGDAPELRDSPDDKEKELAARRAPRPAPPPRSPSRRRARPAPAGPSSSVRRRTTVASGSESGRTSIGGAPDRCAARRTVGRRAGGDGQHRREASRAGGAAVRRRARRPRPLPVDEGDLLDAGDVADAQVAGDGRRRRAQPLVVGADAGQAPRSAPIRRSAIASTCPMV